MINTIFRTACETPSDINQHLPLLRTMSAGLNHVTEFGVRGICSTWVWIHAEVPTIHLYDINHPKDITPSVANYGWDTLLSLRPDIKFFQKSTLECDIEQTDLLFIDTLHTSEQLYRELLLHHTKVNHYIVMHDTELFGERGELPETLGLDYAILPFIIKSSWRIYYKTPDNNGLTILVRR